MKNALSLLAATVVLVGCGNAGEGITSSASRTAGTNGAGPNWSGSDDEPEPVPIPGGTVFGPGLPLVHTFAPGPIAAGYAGIDVEPSTITNFEGLSMIAEDYTLTATATGSDGTKYLLGTDMRVVRGQYLTASGDEEDATFCFI